MQHLLFADTVFILAPARRVCAISYLMSLVSKLAVQPER